MKAAVLEEINGPLTIAEVGLTPLARGQVLVKMLVSGICGSQLQEIAGYKGNAKFVPHLMGHEGVGIVEEIGEGVTTVAPGDKVVMHWRKGAGIESDFPKYIFKGREIASGKVTTFSEYSIASENRVTTVPPDAPNELCALLGCSLSTALGAVSAEAHVKAGESMLIVGAGGLGSNLIRAAKLAGAYPIISIDIHEHKRSWVRMLGADLYINTVTEDLREALEQGAQLKDVDVIIDTSGAKSAIEMTLPLLSGKASLKRLVLKGVAYRHAEGSMPFDVKGVDLDLRGSDLDLEPGLDPVSLLQRSTGDAELSVGSMTAKGIDLSGLSCRISLENGTVRVLEGKAALNQGSMEFSGAANLQDPRKPDCSAKCSMSKVRIPPEILVATPASGILLEGQLSDLSLDLKGKGRDLPELLASASGTVRLKALARAFDFSSMIPGGLVSNDAVTFTGLEAAMDVGNGICDQTVLLTAPDNGLRLTGTTRLSDHECDYTVQPTGKLGRVTGGRAIYLIGPVEHLRPNSAKMMEKEARRQLEEQIKQKEGDAEDLLKKKALEGLGKLLP